MAEPAAVRIGRLKAEAVREEHGLATAPIRDLFGFIERTFGGLFVVRYPMEGGPAGALIRVGERRLIVVNSDSAPLARQRFTAAHELAHHLLDGESIIVVDPADHLRGAGGFNEVRANAFAVHLLVPREVIAGRADEIWPPGGEELVALAMEYGISVTSLVWHASNILGLTEDERAELSEASSRPYQIARRLGLHDRVKQEMAAKGSIGWPRRYLSLLVRALEQGQVTEDELEEWLEDRTLVADLLDQPDEGGDVNSPAASPPSRAAGEDQGTIAG
jgi:Zn-dependent peptidase ImmA (M78 family)